jgi:hypothetical protein
MLFRTQNGYGAGLQFALLLPVTCLEAYKKRDEQFNLMWREGIMREITQKLAHLKFPSLGCVEAAFTYRYLVHLALPGILF